MSVFADRIKNLKESQTIKMARISRELKEQGHDIISLSLGEPDFVTPSYIREGAKKAIDDGFTFYPPISGFNDLRKAISEKFRKENNLDYSPDQIVVSTGAKQSIANVVLCLINPGDEVLIPAPYWVSYSQIIRLAEGIPVFLNTNIDSDFKVSAEQLEKAITPRTKMFVFSSPCNPTGTVYSKEELEKLAEVFSKNDRIFVLSDEIYEHINFSGKHESIASIPQIKDRVIVVNGVSKGYAMTGWRIGYIGATVEIAKACDKIQGQFTSGASSVSQKAALIALSESSKENHHMLKAFKRRRDLVYKLLNEIKSLKVNKPQGAFYFFPDVSAYFGKKNGELTISTPDDLCEYLLKNAGVSVVTGTAFGNSDCIRLSYAASDKLLMEALKRIKASLDKLN